MTIRRCNLVFQGGGVRGIAYAGALQAKPAHVEIVNVAGTSAGAIVAALIAKGYHGKKLQEILADPALTKLLNDVDVERRERIEKAWKEGKPLFGKLIQRMAVRPKWHWGFFGDLWRLKKWANSHSEAFTDLGLIWQARGVHQTRRLREWLDGHLDDLTFDQVRELGHVQSLKVVASDVSGRQFRVFGQTVGDGSIRVAKAVQASVSIPLFFVPLEDDQNLFVDGGMLSNFPSFLFARSEYPTIGFRLVDVKPPKQIASTPDFLLSLLHTMTEAHDVLRGLPDYFKSYEIEVPEDIPATKFRLEPADIDRLYQRGLSVGNSADWERYSSPTKIMPYWDPKPQQALQLSLTEANKLFERYADPAFWVEKLIHKATFTVRIKQDWSTSYERLGTIEVFGSRPLFIGRATVIEPTTLVETSIAEIAHTCTEVTANGETDIIHIPADNAEQLKGFLLFYVPPITAGTPRTFRTGFEIKRELAGSVGKDSTALLSYGVRQVAHDHVLELKFRILIDVELQNFHKLTLTPKFAGSFVQNGTEFDPKESRTYYVHECQLDAKVDFYSSFDVQVGKAQEKAKLTRTGSPV